MQREVFASVRRLRGHPYVIEGGALLGDIRDAVRGGAGGGVNRKMGFELGALADHRTEAIRAQGHSVGIGVAADVRPLGEDV